MRCSIGCSPAGRASIGSRSADALRWGSALRALTPPYEDRAPACVGGGERQRPNPTAATAAAVAAATTTAAAAEAARTLLHGTRFIHHHTAAAHGLAVHARDRCLRFGVAAHLHETEALGPAGLAFHHHLCAGDLAE